MQQLRERLKDQKGFTLVEMLIVVAIIAILIAVSIPMVGNTLEKAREAVDDANFRDAAALGSIAYLQDPDSFDSSKTYWYYTNDAQQGKIFLTTASSTETAGYTKYEARCTCATASDSDSKTGAFDGQNIKVTVGTNGDVEVKWTTT